ncbi:MAG: OmpA family protein [Pseudomonadota bacterium]
MRIFDTILIVIGLAGLAAFGWWGLREMPAASRAIETELQLAAQDELQRAGHEWAQVTMDGQVATIRGTQPNAEMVDEAVRTASTSAGNGGLIYGGVTLVKSVIDAPAVVSPFTWSATNSGDGALTLEGFVPNDGVRTRLLAKAESVAEGTPVTDALALATGVPGEGWTAVAEQAVELVLALDEGEASLRDTRLTVSGFAMDAAIRAVVASEVAAVEPPYSGEADIRGPGRWSARHFRDALIFSGAVESEAERAEILEIANDTFGGTVVDEMTLGEPTYPGWMDGVRLGLPQFGRFFGGEMAFDPEGDGYRFEGQASGSTLRYLSEDLASLVGPYGLTQSASAVDVDVAEVADIDFTADSRVACEEAFASVLATNRVVFETGSAAISRESGETLDKIMAVAGRCAPSLIFELGGHTDSQGARVSNILLSQARAQAVANYMADAGFSSDRLAVVGYGPDQPVSDNTTPEGRAANRRLEFKVLERSE